MNRIRSVYGLPPVTKGADKIDAEAEIQPLKCHNISDGCVGATIAVPVPSVPQLAKLAADTADKYKKQIAKVLDSLACDEITINGAREHLGLELEDKHIYNIKLHESGLNNGKDIMQRRYAAALWSVVMGGKSVNEILTEAGLPPINDKRADKKLVPEPEPEPVPLVKPDVYISKDGDRYEMVFHSGEFKGVVVTLLVGLTEPEYDKAIGNATSAFWPGPKRPIIAYDPTSIRIGPLLNVLNDMRAVPMRVGDAFKALTDK